MKWMEFYYANTHMGLQELLNVSKFTDSSWENQLDPDLLRYLLQVKSKLFTILIPSNV